MNDTNDKGGDVSAINIRRLERENDEMRKLIKDLRSENESLKGISEEAIAGQKFKTEELEHMVALQGTLKKNANMMADIAGRNERENIVLKNQIKTLENKLKSLVADLNDQVAKVEKMEDDKAKSGGGDEELIDASQTIDTLRQQLIQLTVRSSEELNTLQNQLESTRALLHATKLEFDEFSQQTQTDFNHYKHTHQSEYSALEGKCERLNRSIRDNNQRMINEQQQLVDVLNSQFEQYRSTAETLFSVEAKKMETKLNSQNLKHERETQQLIRMKDLHFNRMIKSKDAKIMNLIEGTNMQDTLVRHQLEMDHMRKQHQRDLTLVREDMQQTRDQRIIELESIVAKQENAIEESRHSLKEMGDKVDETHKLLRQSRAQMVLRDNDHADQIQNMQQQIELSQQSADKLARIRETLRHRIIRLRIKLRGDDGDDIESINRRLNDENKYLIQQFNKIEQRTTRSTIDETSLLNQLQKQRAIAVHLKRKLFERTKALQQVTNVLEDVLAIQIHINHRINDRNPGRFIQSTAMNSDRVRGCKGRGMMKVRKLRKEYDQVSNNLRQLTKDMPADTLVMSKQNGSERLSLREEAFESMASPLEHGIDSDLTLGVAKRKLKISPKLARMKTNMNPAFFKEIELSFAQLDRFKKYTRECEQFDRHPMRIDVSKLQQQEKELYSAQPQTTKEIVSNQSLAQDKSSKVYSGRTVDQTASLRMEIENKTYTPMAETTTDAAASKDHQMKEQTSQLEPNFNE